MFSICEVKCCICGRSFDTAGRYNGPTTCGRDCHLEYEWRRTLSILGKDYYPDPSKEVKSGGQKPPGSKPATG